MTETIARRETTMTEVGSGDQEPRPLRLLDIPRFLFEEISAVLGIGEEHEIRLSRGTYRVRAVNPAHRATGFEGAVGFRSMYDDYFQFVIWGIMPKQESADTVAEPRALLGIEARPVDGGVWTISRGNYVVESLTAELPFSDGLNLESSAVKIIALALVRASDLARDPGCLKSAYWDGTTSQD